MKTSCLRLKLVELNFLVSFNTDDQSKTDVANAINVITDLLFVGKIVLSVQIGPYDSLLLIFIVKRIVALFDIVWKMFEIDVF